MRSELASHSFTMFMVEAIYVDKKIKNFLANHHFSQVGKYPTLPNFVLLFLLNYLH